jgi:hypothetical protein
VYSVAAGVFTLQPGGKTFVEGLDKVIVILDSHQTAQTEQNILLQNAAFQFRILFAQQAFRVS